MKNKLIVLVAIICGIFLIIVAICYTFNKRNEIISKKLELNLENCKIEKDEDSHGGFLGDGEYFAKIKCSDKQDDYIKKNWKELPLPEELKRVLDIITYDNKGGLNVYDRYNIPNIENGYYYFLDRHSDSIDNKNPEEINNRSSYNFSLGIYDSNNMILYFYELDT